MSGSLGFTSAWLDRADQLRGDEVGLEQAKSDPRARCLAMNGVDFIPSEEGGLRWQFVDPDDSRELLLLGRDEQNIPFFVREDGRRRGVDARSRTIMRFLPLLSPQDLALYGAARSLVDWHARHGFCASCGGETRVIRAGWGRNCYACNAEHFPRVDPVVIMLAEYENKILLGRQPGFPPGFFSALAGFVEPGESLEEAVKRELFEEAGLKVRDVRYIASQPWPFPSSLMIGCVATAETFEIILDETELEAAMWVDRAEVLAALAGDMDASFVAPPPMAIARHLLHQWVEKA